MHENSCNLNDLAAIRIVLQRVCLEGGFINLYLEGREWPFPLLAESETGIFIEVTLLQRTQWGLEPGSHYQMTLVDRGRRYQAMVKLEGWGDLEGKLCACLHHPRELNAPDFDGVSDYVPDQPITCTFTSPAMNIFEGQLRALGNDGMAFALWGTRVVKEVQLKTGAPTSVELTLAKGVKVNLTAVTTSMDANVAAVRFSAKTDPGMLRVYRGWLRDVILAQERKDREGFNLKGMRANRGAAPARVPGLPAVHLLGDKDPLVLVIGGDGFPQRIHEALGRKFGIAELDFVQGDVRPMLGALGADAPDWGRTRLILIHQRLRLSSGLELTRQLTQEEGCPLPILVAGSEEDVGLKRNRAIAAGAVDFISVDPFRILTVMHSLEQTLKMFT